MFFQKMAICEYQILAIFGQFWPFRAHFGPWVSKVYLLQLFRCKKNNEITKSGSISLFGKLDPSGAPKPTLGPKTPLKGPGRAKIGVNAPHVVQLTGLGPKKPNLNRSSTNSVPFTRNHPQKMLAAHRLVASQYWHIVETSETSWTCGTRRTSFNWMLIAQGSKMLRVI